MLPKGFIPYTHKDITKLDLLIDNCISDYCVKYNIDLMDSNIKYKLPHNEVANIIRYIYNSVIRLPLEYCYMSGFNNALLDYDDIILFNYLVDKYLSICSYFNKSLGVYSFSVFIGVDYNDVMSWLDLQDNKQKLNVAHCEGVRRIRDYKARSLVDILQNSGLGALAVANNDEETNLKWQQNQAPKVEKETVYFLPSERVDRLKLDKNNE